MYQALYRKYRSQTFSQLVGQEIVAKTLKQAVEQEKISHAYLFSGPRGTGKTSVAKIFAKAMNCPNQEGGEPCNNCYICQAVTDGSLEDVIEMDAASNNGVDEIRDIRDKSTYAPSVAQYKVYIIDEVHMLSTGAFNALLKTLEEPTPNVVFILATTELHKIPATILSRVQRFEFKSIRTQDIRDHIFHILEKEGIAYETEAVEIIARRAEGGMRDALSILDQALSLTQDARLTTAVSEEITGTISLSALDNYVAALAQKDVTRALENLNLIFDNGKSMTRFVTDLLQYLRDILIVQTGGENTHYSDLFKDNLVEIMTSSDTREDHRLTDTYFHNFITHLLEAAFQRKVYTLIEEGETFGASKLNSIMKEVLTDFWGDAIEIDDDAALTWMRQAHYYMGLYSYTYSAGLVISTAGYLHLKHSETGAEDWLNLLKSGGSKTPLESAMIIGADISTDKPLRDTIQFLSDTVDQIIAYSAQLGD